MDLTTLAQLGEFLGGAFVVVSLVYLAHQVRQNTKSLQTENYSRVLDRMSMIQSRLAADVQLNRIVVIGSRDPSRLTPSERIRLSWALYEMLGAGEFMYHQAQQGSLQPEIWDRWRRTIAWWLTQPGIRAWWEAKPTPFVSSFQAFGDELIRRGPPDAAAEGRWAAFIDGDGPPDRDEA